MRPKFWAHQNLTCIGPYQWQWWYVLYI